MFARVDYDGTNKIEGLVKALRNVFTELRLIALYLADILSVHSSNLYPLR